MAQTTDAFSSVNAAIEYATDGGTTWNDIAGETSKVAPSGGTRQTNVKYTFDGDTAVITSGKREPLQIAITILDTNSSSGVIDDLVTYYESGSNVRFRWAPAGGATGDYRYTTASTCIIKDPPYPGADAEDSTPTNLEINLETPSLTRAAIS